MKIVKNVIQSIKMIKVKALSRNINNQLWNKDFHKAVQDLFGIFVGIGSYGYLQFPKGTKIGNYCSFAEGVKYLSGNHPINNVSTAACFFNPDLGYVSKKYDIERKNLNIGNDVWIGSNVLITNGCTKIGNGVVIGAGSVVTHDIEPYSIVGGNPAHEIKKRFSNDICECLEKTQWWNFPPEFLSEYIEYMKNPYEFINILTKKVYCEGEASYK